MRKIIFLFSILSLSAYSAWTPPPESIYNIKSQFMRFDDKSVSLNSFQGKTVVLAMIYLSCPVVCPMTLGKMKQIASKVPDAKKRDVVFVLVSFDPKKDTPKVMRQFLKDKGLDENWVIMTAQEKDLRTLGAALDFVFKKTDEKDYTHSTGIYLIDPNGLVLKTPAEQLPQMLSN